MFGARPDSFSTKADNNIDDDVLVDYEAEEEQQQEEAGDQPEQKEKKGHVGIHSSGFKDFLLKPELLQAINKHGFEHPSEVQQESIPQAILGMDVICQAKSGMGKTACFVLSTLQQLDPVDGEISVIVLCHTRELAFQIAEEYQRFSENLKNVRTEVIFGGIDIKTHRQMLRDDPPHVVVGTPGRILALVREGSLKLNKIKSFVVDECDRMMESLDMRADVQTIFKATPHEKQVMMFSATMSKETRAVCKRFMSHPIEIAVDDDSKLTLHGLVQHYIKLEENEKNRKLSQLLDTIDFNLVVIFVKSVQRAIALKKLLVEQNFPAECIHSGMRQEERMARFQDFKATKHRIMVATDVFARGVDVSKINVSISYDMASSSDEYLHRSGRAGRFGTRGLAISFVSSETDAEVLNAVQSRFEVAITEAPETIDPSTYMSA